MWTTDKLSNAPKPHKLAHWASLRAGSLSHPLVLEYLGRWLADALQDGDIQVALDLQTLILGERERQLKELRASAAAASDTLTKGLGAECWDWVRSAREGLSKALLRDGEGPC